MAIQHTTSLYCSTKTPHSFYILLIPIYKRKYIYEYMIRRLTIYSCNSVVPVLWLVIRPELHRIAHYFPNAWVLEYVKYLLSLRLELCNLYIWFYLYFYGFQIIYFVLKILFFLLLHKNRQMRLFDYGLNFTFFWVKQNVRFCLFLVMLIFLQAIGCP